MLNEFWMAGWEMHKYPAWQVSRPGLQAVEPQASPLTCLCLRSIAWLMVALPRMKSKAGKSSVGQLARILVTATGMSAHEGHGSILCTLGRVRVRQGGPT